VEQGEIVGRKSVLLKDETECGEAVNSMTASEKAPKLGSTEKVHSFDV
jgi:hypothetical protein